MRRWFPVVIVALFVCVVLLQFSSPAQEQSQAPRKVVSQFAPVYPDLARKMQLRGTVRVEITVARNGTVKSTHVIGGNPLLARAAIDAVEKWRWVAGPDETKET